MLNLFLSTEVQLKRKNIYISSAMNQLSYTQNSTGNFFNHDLTDVSLLDYGARMYTPELGRFFNLDPLAEEYYGLSSYSYCAGNPINSFDVNGEWIYIIHEGQTYKYDNGTLYQYQTDGDNSGKYTQCEAEEGSFLAGVVAGLNDLATKTDAGQGIVDYFGNDDNDAYIWQNDWNENVIDMANSSNNIYLSPNLEGTDIPTEKGLQKSEFWIDIGHELAHRIDILQRGKEATKQWLVNPTSGKIIPESEKYATHKENQMREATGMPLRTHYSKQGDGGWEDSRIIDRKGNSIYYPGVNYMPLKLRKKIARKKRRAKKR